jgi:hypothetical protein
MASNIRDAQLAGPSRIPSISITQAIKGSWHAHIQHFNFKVINLDFAADGDFYHMSNEITINNGNTRMYLAVKTSKEPNIGYTGLFLYVKPEVDTQYKQVLSSLSMNNPDGLTPRLRRTVIAE